MVMIASSAKRRKKPFTPGTGHRPEHVAGRKREFALLEGALQGIAPSEVREKDGLLEHDLTPPIVLTGPRGVGKTLLLTWMQERAQEMEINVARLAHAKDVAAGDAMGRLLKELARGADKKALKAVKGFNASIPGFGLGVDLRDDPADGFEQVLRARLSQGPLALLMDEAHHYQENIMGFMLQSGQRLINEKYPLVILLAGTPDLRSYLMNIEATFMTRSKRIYINLLTTKESKDALSKPFTNRGIEVEPEALEMMWGMTDNYPFFVQLVGSEVWEALLKKGKRRVDVALIEQVQEEIGDQRIDFYSTIYDELDDEDLTSYALQAAEAIIRQEGAPVRKKDIRLALLQENSGLKAPDARKIIDSLQRLGVIWQGRKGHMTAGIPSFFTYLQETEQGTVK